VLRRVIKPVFVGGRVENNEYVVMNYLEKCDERLVSVGTIGSSRCVVRWGLVCEGSIGNKAGDQVNV
jgi:hypothetical protein